jgi:uncharacterized phage-associated protein
LRNQYKANGSQIIAPSEDYEFTSEFSEKQEELLREVNDVYGQFSGLKLMNMTHEERPWIEAIETKRQEISLDTMRSYFKEQIVAE